MAREHVVFLAFADARGDLPELREESRRLQELFERFRDDGRCSLIFKPTATWDQIYQVLITQPDDIAIFHFGGHADEGRLLLDTHLGAAAVEGEGLAALLGRRGNLKLAFLNGCSTRPQVQRLLDAGIAAVIATARPIDDRAACKLAVAFYEALTAGGEAVPAGGRSLRAAFDAARAYVTAWSQADGQSRHLIPGDRPQVAQDLTNGDGMPWDLFVRPGAEQVERWNLFEDDPLFGLPGLPIDIGWPVEPYRNLEYFQCEHARIFFGRGRAIRELYNLLTLPTEPAQSRLIFYYGQTGVGKTSVLAAGLLPRVEPRFATRYCRRSAKGLLGTLGTELAPGADPFDLGTAWLEIEHEAQRPLLIVLDQAEEAFTRPRADSRPKDEVRALFEAVHEAFAPTRAERPRGRLILSFRKEWLAEFDEIRKSPDLKLDIKPMMLDPLDRAGVVEAIEGPAEHFGLDINPDRIRVKPGEVTLAEYMSHDMFDTLANPQTEQESPIAPTLQILLTRMWKEAKKRQPDRPTFDRALFQILKGKGFKLDEVIQEQFGKIAEDEGLREAVEKGLLLDLLEFFTTHEGTADTHTRQQIHDRYRPHQPPERLDALLEACQNRYLLAHVGVDKKDGTPTYRLTHDTLAPLLRERFRVSQALAQRARHALEGRAATWKGRPADPVLDRVDLASIDEALPWMRTLEKDEQALLEASREAERRRLADEVERQSQLLQARQDADWARAERQGETERRLKDQKEANRKLTRRAYYLLFALVVVIVVSCLAVFWGLKAQSAAASFREQVVRTRSLLLATRAKAESSQRPQLAVLLSAEAIDILASHNYPIDPEVEGTFRMLIESLGGQALGGIRGQITRVTFSPNNRFVAIASTAGRVRLWELRAGQLAVQFADLRADGIEGEGTSPVGLTCHGFDGSGTHYATGVADGTVTVWSVEPNRCKRIRTLKCGNGPVGSLKFRPDGRLAGAGYDGTVRLWGSDLGAAVELTGGVGPLNTLAISKDGRWLAVGDTTGVVALWDLGPAGRGNPRRIGLPPDSPLHSGQVNTALFSSNGRFLATASIDGTAHLYELRRGANPGVDATKRLPHDGSVNALAFTPDSRFLATAASDGMARLWNCQERIASTESHIIFKSEQNLIFYDIEITQDGHRLALACSDGLIRIFDGDGGGQFAASTELHGHDDSVFDVAFSSDSHHLGSCSVDGFARLWDTRSFGSNCVTSLITAHEGNVPSLSFDDSGTLLTTGGWDGCVQVWSVSDEAKGAICRLVRDEQPLSLVQRVTFSRDGRVAAAGSDGAIRVFNRNEARTYEKRVLAGHNGPVFDLAFHSDGRLVGAGYDGIVRLWGPDLGAAVELTGGVGPLNTLAISKDGRWLAAGGTTGVVALWDLGPDGRGNPRRIGLTAHGDRITALAFSPDGRWLASAADDSIARLHPLTSASSGTDSALELDRGSLINCLEFSPDSRYLVSGDMKGMVRRWGIRDHASLVPEEGQAIHNAMIYAIKYSPDGRFLGTASADGTACLCDLTRIPASVVRLQGRGGALTSLTFSRDGHRLATTGGGGTVLLHTTSLEAMMNAVPVIVGRDMSKEEKELYTR